MPSSINSKLQAVSENKYKEALEFQKYLEKENGFFEQVSNSLELKGYSFRIMYSVFSKDDIKMKYILSDVTEFEKEEIKSIFFELVEKNNLNSNVFELKVSDNDDGPDW